MLHQPQLLENGRRVVTEPCLVYKSAQGLHFPVVKEIACGVLLQQHTAGLHKRDSVVYWCLLIFSFFCMSLVSVKQYYRHCRYPYYKHETFVIVSIYPFLKSDDGIIVCPWQVAVVSYYNCGSI